MAGFRSRRTYRPPTSKNVVQNSNFDIVANTTTTETLATVPATFAGGTNEVRVGTRIKAIWLELYMFSGGIATARSITMAALFFNRAGLSTVPTLENLGSSNLRQNVFFFTRGIPGTQVSGSPIVWRGWIRVPRTFQKFNEGDALQLVLRNTVDVGSYCFDCIYKWST